jgi:hypothetical protein
VVPLLKPVDKCWQPADFLPASEDPDFLDKVGDRAAIRMGARRLCSEKRFGSPRNMCSQTPVAKLWCSHGLLGSGACRQLQGMAAQPLGIAAGR